MRLINFSHFMRILKDFLNKITKSIAHNPPLMLVENSLEPISSWSLKSSHASNSSMDFLVRYHGTQINRQAIINTRKHTCNCIRNKAWSFEKSFSKYIVTMYFSFPGSSIQLLSSSWIVVILFLLLRIMVDLWKNYVLRSPKASHFDLDFWNHKSSSWSKVSSYSLQTLCKVTSKLWEHLEEIRLLILSKVFNNLSS